MHPTENWTRCPGSGQQTLSDGACPHCESRLTTSHGFVMKPHPRYCKHHGRRRFEGDAVFCNRCGEELELPQDVLCKCGWGRLACPADELPVSCPLCGHVFVPPDLE